MKRVLLAVLTILVVSGCAAHKPQKPKAVNQRIIYRDLTKPVDQQGKNSNNQNSMINSMISESALIKSLAESKSKDDL